MIVLGVKKLHASAIIPEFASDEAAAFDINSSDTGYVEPGSQTVFGTGLSFAIPRGYSLLVFSRSGHGFKQGVRLANCVGVIDSDYTGELKVALRNDGDTDFRVQAGDRIAQAILIPVLPVTLEEVSETRETERGGNGFGSTGA